MLASFDNNNINAILISESWLKPCLSRISYSIPGFQVIRNDRTGSAGGGVAIYLRSHISFSIVSLSAQPPSPNAGEHLLIEVDLSHAKILLGVYYCPSLRINFFSSFEALLELYCPSYTHTIIMGDFNTCLLKQDSRSQSFQSLIKSNSLTILPLTATHFYPNSTPSLLDLMLVSSPDTVSKHGQCAADVFLFHNLIYLSYEFRPTKSKPKCVLRRSFGGIDMESLRKDAKEQDWSDVVNADSVHEKIERFNNIVINIYDKYAPLKPIKLKHLPAPWLSTEIKSLMQKKLVSKNKYKLRPTDDNKERYIRYRNQCNRACRDAQRRHIHILLSKMRIKLKYGLFLERWELGSHVEMITLKI